MKTILATSLTLIALSLPASAQSIDITMPYLTFPSETVSAPVDGTKSTNTPSGFLLKQ